MFFGIGTANWSIFSVFYLTMACFVNQKLKNFQNAQIFVRILFYNITERKFLITSFSKCLILFANKIINAKVDFVF